MATYSNNTTMKVSSAISATSTTDGATLYTAPANGYAIIQVSIACVGLGDSSQIRIGGHPVLSAYGTSPSTTSSSVFGEDNSGGPANVFYERGIYVGPGQSVTLHTNNSRVATISGVEFVNTP